MYLINRFIIVYIFLFLISCYSYAEKPSNEDATNIGLFSASALNGWQNKEFKGHTDYSAVKVDNITVVEAVSDNAASGLFYEKKIDLEKTPYLNWRWRVEAPIINSNELSKKGDDFVARVYVVVSGGLVFWNTRAINYVWTSQLPKDKVWLNPYAGDHAMMVAMRSISDGAGVWYTEKRNILADFKSLTDQNIRQIDAIAIMTDTDNTGNKAKAYYGDLYFSAD
jgi:hypothetical protein